MTRLLSLLVLVLITGVPTASSMFYYPPRYSHPTPDEEDDVCVFFWKLFDGIQETLIMNDHGYLGLRDPNPATKYENGNTWFYVFRNTSCISKIVPDQVEECAENAQGSWATVGESWVMWFEQCLAG